MSRIVPGGCARLTCFINGYTTPLLIKLQFLRLDREFLPVEESLRLFTVGLSAYKT